MTNFKHISVTIEQAGHFWHGQTVCICHYVIKQIHKFGVRNYNSRFVSLDFRGRYRLLYSQNTEKNLHTIMWLSLFIYEKPRLVNRLVSQSRQCYWHSAFVILLTIDDKTRPTNLKILMSCRKLNLQANY